MVIAILLAHIPIAVAIFYIATKDMKPLGIIPAIGMSLVFLFVFGTCVGVINLDEMDPENDFRNKTEVAEYTVCNLDDVAYWHEKEKNYSLINLDGVPTKVKLLSVTHSNDVDRPIVKKFEYNTLSQWYKYIYMLPMEVNGYHLILPEE